MSVWAGNEYLCYQWSRGWCRHVASAFLMVGFTGVSSWRTNRRVLSWLSLAFMGLAFSVFGWGTGYKLSLYDPPGASSHLMPQAKLLSRDEQTPAGENSLISRTKDPKEKGAKQTLLTILFLYALSAASLCRAPASGQRERESNDPWRLRHRASLNFFFALPPPVLA